MPDPTQESPRVPLPGSFHLKMFFAGSDKLDIETPDETRSAHGDDALGEVSAEFGSYFDHIPTQCPVYIHVSTTLCPPNQKPILVTATDSGYCAACFAANPEGTYRYGGASPAAVSTPATARENARAATHFVSRATKTRKATF